MYRAAKYAGRNLSRAFDSGGHVVATKRIKVCLVKSGGLNTLLVLGTLQEHLLNPLKLKSNTPLTKNCSPFLKSKHSKVM